MARACGEPDEIKEKKPTRKILPLCFVVRFGTELVTKRGVQMNSMLWDDGWDDQKSLWSFNKKTFPHGFDNIKVAADKYNIGTGVWVSPWGGYGEAKETRIKFGKKDGYELSEMETGVGFSLSGPKYFKRFSEIMLNMVTRYGVNMFKIDGIGFEGDRTIIAQEMSGMLKLCKEVRAKAAEGRKPGANDLFISLTTGTWPSPFWLQHGDSIWRGHGDIGIEGPRECPWRLRWVTYRDAVVYHLVHRKSPWFPLSSLMLHGIIVGAVGQSRAARLNHLFSEGKEKKRDITDFEHEVWTYFGMGVNLQELYLSPDLMTPEAWDVVAKAAKWSRSNVEVFQDSHWIGGDPLEYQMGVVYGFASFSPRLKRATITLRNPSMKTALCVLRKKSGNVFRVGIFLDFVRRSGTTRAEGPHGGVTHRTCREPNEIVLTIWSRAEGLWYRFLSGTTSTCATTSSLASG